MGMPGTQELIIIFLIVVLLFGAKKIPDLAKGIGKGIKNFKNEMKDEDTEEAAKSEAPKKVEGGEATASSETPKETEKQA